MNEDEQQLNTARLGIEAETFLRSHLGRYLVERADRLINDYTDDLIECDPGDVACNTQCRNQIHVGALFKQFLHEAIQAGQNAHNQINQQEALSE